MEPAPSVSELASRELPMVTEPFVDKREMLPSPVVFSQPAAVIAPVFCMSMLPPPALLTLEPLRVKATELTSEILPLVVLVAVKPVTALEALVRVAPPTLEVVKRLPTIGAVWVRAPPAVIVTFALVVLIPLSINAFILLKLKTPEPPLPLSLPTLLFAAPRLTEPAAET